MLINYWTMASKSQLVYVEIAVLLGIDARPFTFSYAELKTATEDFNPANKLGEGGFGPVYKVSPSLIKDTKCLSLCQCLRVCYLIQV